MVKRSAQLEEQVTGKITETGGEKYHKHLRKILLNIYLQWISELPFCIPTTVTKNSFAASALVKIFSNNYLFVCI